MNLIERVKKIMLSPKSEWEKIDAENLDMKTVIVSYVLPLTVVAAICAFIGYGFIGINVGMFKMRGINWGIYYALTALITPLISVVIAAYVVDMLAPSFGSEKNINKSASLVGFSYTPALVGSFLAILPMLGIIGGLLGLYGIYLWYLGLGPMKGTPDDKKIVYMLVTIIILIVTGIIVGGILSRILLPAFGLSMPGLSL